MYTGAALSWGLMRACRSGLVLYCSVLSDAGGENDGSSAIFEKSLLAEHWQGRRALSNRVCAHSVISMWHVVCLQHLARACSEQSRSTTVLPINHVIQMPQCLSGFVNHDYCNYLNLNEWHLVRISMKFFLKIEINNKSSLVQVLAWRGTGYWQDSWRH